MAIKVNAREHLILLTSAVNGIVVMLRNIRVLFDQKVKEQLHIEFVDPKMLNLNWPK